MPTIEERMQALEQEHAELKQKIELQTIAISGLVNKTMLERISEKNDKIFQTLITHDEFTNRQLSEFRERVEVQVEGKITGMQTEMRQHFTEQDGKIVGLQTEMRQRLAEQNSKVTELQTTQAEHTTMFTEQKTLLTEILARLPEKP